MTWHYTQKILRHYQETTGAHRWIQDIKVSECKIDIQKSVAFSYPNSKILEREIKEIIPFAIISKRKKYLEISLPKKAKELDAEN